MRILPKISLFFVIVILLGSCNIDENNENKSVLCYNESSGIVTLDPAFARDQSHIWICNQLYNSLVKLDDSLNIIPSIAHSWDISDDGKNIYLSSSQ